MADLIGQTFGAYRIESLLGNGGMGQVYRAVHQHLGRPAAIKILHDFFASDPGFQARFLQEARAASALEHPNIVNVLDFNQEAGRFYLVMELVPDGSLRSMLQQSRVSESGEQSIPLAVGLDIVYQAALGLAYAHDRGMVHRDIKPDNLLLRRRDDPSFPSGYEVRITDFGLVRLAEGGVQTADGVTMGTPAYISPEQCRGLPLDGRSDIYSLGVVLFEVATGALPLETKTLSDAIFKHVSTPPPSPIAMRPDLPPLVAEIILRCLAKHPDDRYSTARDLAAALREASLIQRSQPPVPPEGIHPTV